MSPIARSRSVAALLLLLALVHALPALAFFDPSTLQALYGTGEIDANVELLLRHRALLFAVVTGTLALGAFRPAYRSLSLAVGWVSVVSFILLAVTANGINPLLHRVAIIDAGLCVLLAAATALSTASAQRS